MVVGGGGRWVVAGGGRWWSVVVVGGHGRPREATGGRRGQFPRTDSSPTEGIYSSDNTAKTPKATLVWQKCRVRNRWKIRKTLSHLNYEMVKHTKHLRIVRSVKVKNLEHWKSKF